MLTNRIADLSLPSIAAVNGVAMGAGLEICLACDLAAATTTARFAFPEVRLGMIPCGGGTQRLARLVGLRRARDMVMTGRILAAEQALEWGLVNEVVPPDELREWVDGWTEKLSQGGRIALYQAKRCLNHSLDMDLNRGLEYETECFTTCFSSGESAQGLRRYSRAEEAPGEAAGEPEAEKAEAFAAAGPSGAGGEEPGEEGEAPVAAEPGDGEEGTEEVPALGEEAAPEEEEEDYGDIFE